MTFRDAMAQIAYTLRLGKLLRNRKDVGFFLFGTSNQTNLGDHAISMAELEFFSNNFPGVPVYEIPKQMFYRARKPLKRRVSNHDIVIVTGGGFLGDLWISEEQLVRDVITTFKDNPIIIMPQTLFFAEGSKEIGNTASAYGAASDLNVFLRDHESFNRIKRLLPGLKNIYLAPDMALTLRPSFEKRASSSRAGLCLRSDGESLLGYEEKCEVERIVSAFGYKPETVSTVLAEPIKIKDRAGAVHKKLKEFSEYDLIITDRLHAMIFSALVRVPCVVLDNISKKVSGVYFWIKDLNYITVVGDLSDLQSAISVVTSTDKNYFGQSFDEEYETIRHLISDKLKLARARAGA